MRRRISWTLFILILAFVIGQVPKHASALSPETAEQEETTSAGGHSSEEGGEGHEASPIFRWINFAILVGALGYVLRKPAAQFFAERTATIRKGLEDGRSALAAAEEKLRTVEEKLQGFEKEMADFRAAARKEMEEEHARMRQATAQEAEKMMESVRVQMDVASKQAQLDLRLYTAGQAVDLAEKVIAGRMNEAREKRLVTQFVQKVGTESRQS